MASAVLENQQAIEQLKRECRNNKQVNRGDPIGMIAEERLPSLRWGPPVPCHVFGDRGLANFDAELEELTVDPGRAPEGIGKAHVTDQLANFERNLWPCGQRHGVALDADRCAVPVLRHFHSYYEAFWVLCKVEFS